MSTQINKSYLALLVTASLGLSACGGGGGGDGGGTTPTNTAPTISGTPTTSVNENQEYSFSPNASDANNDTLTFSIENKPEWATFSSSNGALTGIPSFESAGNFANIIISVSDGSLNSSLAAFDLDVVNTNRAPEIVAIDDLTVDETVSFSQALDFSDADGDDLSVSFNNLPAWLSYDQQSQTLAGTPGLTDAGENSIEINVSDTEATTSYNLSLTVAQSLQVSGNVLDGYIKGAKVFLDINNDGIKNTNEPAYITDENGHYSFVVLGSDLADIQTNYIRAYMAAGAEDTARAELNFGETPVTFSLSPLAQVDANTDMVADAHITPYTTQVSHNLSQRLDLLTGDITLEQIKAELANANNEEITKILSALGIDTSHASIAAIKAAINGDFLSSEHSLPAAILEQITAKAIDLANLEIALQDVNDSDNDGFSDLYEAYMGSDPHNSVSTPDDLDGDGYSNEEEIAAGSDPENPLSTLEDLDGDGYTNDEEEFYGTDPSDPESNPGDRDGDGVPNGGDAFPEDASEHADTDGDGLGDNADLDRDGNGINDADEAAIVTGRNFNCSIAIDKTVSCDPNSDNTFGQINVPAELANVELLATGGAHSCAVSSDANNTAVCWGDNSFKQLDVTPASGKIVQLVLADNFSCLLSEDNDNLIGYTLSCFGDLPEMPEELTEVNGAILGLEAGAQQLCATSSVFVKGIDRGVPYCWAADPALILPTASAGFGDSTLQVTDFILGESYSCSVDNKKGHVCVGSISKDQDITATIKMAGGDNHVCVLDDLAAVTCWGDNTYGQLEIGNALDNVVVDSIFASANTTCAYSKDANAAPICWGATTEFNAGNLSQNIALLTGGDTYKCAILADGSSQCDGTIDGDGNDDGLTDLFDGAQFTVATDANHPDYSICMGVKATDQLACLATTGLEYPTVSNNGQEIVLSTNAVIKQGNTNGQQGGVCVLDNGQVNCISGMLQNDTAYSTTATEMAVGSFTVCYIDDSGVNCHNAHTEIASNLVDNMPDFSEHVNFSGLAVYNDLTAEYACVMASKLNSQEKEIFNSYCWGSAEQGQTAAPTFSAPADSQFMLTSQNACLVQKQKLQCWGNTENGIGSADTNANEEVFVYPSLNNELVIIDGEEVERAVKIIDAALSFKQLCYISASGLHCFGNDPAFAPLTMPTAVAIDGADTCVIDGINVLVDDTAANGGTNVICQTSDFSGVQNILDVDVSPRAACVFADDKTVCKSTIGGYLFDGEVSAPVVE